VTFMVTVNDPEPLTTWPVPETPLLFCATILKVMVGVGETVAVFRRRMQRSHTGPQERWRIASFSATSAEPAASQCDTACSYTPS